MPAENDLIPIDQAVREYGLGRSTIYRWIEAGRLTKHERAAGRPRVFVDRREIRKLLEPQATRRKRKP